MENIKLIHGDCLEVMRKIPNKSIKLVVTDPPYLHNKGGNGGGHTKLATSSMYDKDSPMIAKMSEFTKDKCFEMLDEIKRIMIIVNGYFFCNDSLIPYYCNWALENKFKYTILTWNKPLSILNRERFSTNMEYIVRIYDKGTALNKLDFEAFPEKKEYYSKYRYANQIRGKNKHHPLQKPIELLNGFIELSSNEGDLILDPFMGSGSTGVACKNLNRNFIGIELDENYFNIAKDIIDKHEVKQ